MSFLHNCTCYCTQDYITGWTEEDLILSKIKPIFIDINPNILDGVFKNHIFSKPLQIDWTESDYPLYYYENIQVEFVNDKFLITLNDKLIDSIIPEKISTIYIDNDSTWVNIDYFRGDSLISLKLI